MMLAQLNNSGAVSAMNSSQQAAWVNGLGDSKGGRTAARRTTIEGDPKVAFLEDICGLEELPDDNDDTGTSFLSLEGSNESMKNGEGRVKELVEADTEGILQVPELAAVFGGHLGYAVAIRRGNYPDSATVVILSIKLGFFLTMGDLIYATSTGNDITNPLDREDSDVINMVVPTDGLNPDSGNRCKTIRDLMFSFFLRNSFTPVPGDLSGVIMACIVKMLSDKEYCDFSTLELKEMFNDFVATMNTMNTGSKFASSLEYVEVNNISSLLTSKKGCNHLDNRVFWKVLGSGVDITEDIVRAMIIVCQRLFITKKTKEECVEIVKDALFPVHSRLLAKEPFNVEPSSEIIECKNF